MHDAVILEKMRILNKLASRMGWVLSLSIPPQVLLNKMSVLYENLPSFSMCHAKWWKMFFLLE